MTRHQDHDGRTEHAARRARSCTRAELPRGRRGFDDPRALARGCRSSLVLLLVIAVATIKSPELPVQRERLARPAAHAVDPAARSRSARRS